MTPDDIKRLKEAEHLASSARWDHRDGLGRYEGPAEGETADRELREMLRPHAIELISAYEERDRLRAEIAIALEALRLIDTFAWSTCQADCEEAHEECMRRINACRAAIRKLEGER
jgi:hypothetical protein